MSSKIVAQARVAVEAAEKRILELQAKLEMEQARACSTMRRMSPAC